MAEILIAALSPVGHISPLLAVAQDLVARGDRVTVMTGAAHSDTVHATGAQPHPLPAIAEEPVHLLATGVFATALQSLAPAFEASSGSQIQVSIANAGEVAARAAAGEPADLVMTSSAGVKALAKQGAVLSDEVVIGKMRLGVAVRSGAAMQSLGASLASADTFRTLLISAEKVAYIDPNGGGTSGPFFEKMFASLGVADAVHAKAVLCKTGAEIVNAVSSGRAAIGMPHRASA